MVHWHRDQRGAVPHLQAAARAVLLVLRTHVVGRHPAAALHHPRRLWRVEGPGAVHHAHLPLVVHHGGAAELGALLAAAPADAHGQRAQGHQIRPHLQLDCVFRSDHGDWHHSSE